MCLNHRKADLEAPECLGDVKIGGKDADIPTGRNLKKEYAPSQSGYFS